MNRERLKCTSNQATGTVGEDDYTKAIFALKVRVFVLWGRPCYLIKTELFVLIITSTMIERMTISAIIIPTNTSVLFPAALL